MGRTRRVSCSQASLRDAWPSPRGECAESVRRNVGVNIRQLRQSPRSTTCPHAEIAEALARMNDGRVPLLSFETANPVFTLPRSGRFAEAVAKVAFKGVLELSEGLPSLRSRAADHHPLESWERAGEDEVMSLQQPRWMLYSARAPLRTCS